MTAEQHSRQSHVSAEQVGKTVQDASKADVATAAMPKLSKPTSSAQSSASVHNSVVSYFWSPGASTAIPAHLSVAAQRVAITAFCLGTLAGIVLPRALDMLASKAQSDWSTSEGAKPSFYFAVTRPQLHLYLLAWAIFHLLEFMITARYNATRLFSDSFLISNGLTYHLAHMLGVCEFIAETMWLTQHKQIRWYTYAAFCILVAGQTTRSLAMVHAASNFSHEVAIRKRDDHVLVTDGIYAIFRHPSYAGFFYWALATQVMLGNPISTCVFAFVLWRFFSHRIRNEEAYLVHFFGQPYRDFRARTKTWIPFVP